MKALDPLRHTIHAAKRRPWLTVGVLAIAGTLIGFGVKEGLVAFAPLVIEGVAHSAVRKSIEGTIEAIAEEAIKEVGHSG